MTSRDPNYLFFATPAEWREWLVEHHARAVEVWVGFYKVGFGRPSLTWPEAVDEALCFGWIDGQSKSFDEKSYLQKFTPRRIKSIWSKRNIGHIARLIKEGKMKPSGLKEAEAAKADGRWERAYDSPGNLSIPEDFLRELSKDKNALTFFESLNKENIYAITWRLQTAKKPETREKRMKIILEMLSRGEKFH